MSEEFPKDEMDEGGSMDMDAVTAHLDRGWDLLGKGDIPGARVSAHHILQLDGDSPEGHTLLGAIASAEGDAEDAMDLFMRAIETDPEYVDALLYAAEIAIHPVGDYELALRLCDDADEMLGVDDPERLDIWLLRAEARLASGAPEESWRDMSEIPKAPYPDPAYYLRVGRICLDLGRLDAAMPLLLEALQHERTRADGHYFVGIAHDLLGDRAKALENLITVHKLDAEQRDPSWAVSSTAFETCVAAAISRVPQPFSSQLSALPLRVHAAPPLELVAEGFDPRALVFLAGASPQVEDPDEGKAPSRRRRPALPTGGGRKPADALGTPSCLFIYKDNVERFVGNGNEGSLVEEIFRSLAEEVAFYFGLDETESTRLLMGSGVVEH